MHDEHGRRSRGRGLPLSELDPSLTEVSRKLIGCAIEVHKGLGPGYEREVYIKALTGELGREGVSLVLDKSYDVEYAGETVGTAVADGLVGDRFLVTLLARPGDIGSYERSQLRSRLRAADLELGLIVNFAERRLKDGLVRVLNPDKLNALRGDDHDDAHDDYDHE